MHHASQVRWKWPLPTFLASMALPTLLHPSEPVQAIKQGLACINGAGRAYLRATNQSLTVCLVRERTGTEAFRSVFGSRANRMGLNRMERLNSRIFP